VQSKLLAAKPSQDCEKRPLASSCLSVGLSACNLYAPYCDVICGPLVFTIFFRQYLLKSPVFEKKLLNIKCVVRFCLQFLFKTFLIIGRILRDIIINVKTFHVKLRSCLSDFNINSTFSTDFYNTHRYQVSSKSVLWEHSSMRTDKTKLIVTFRNFANAPKEQTPV
jgi:hypothetical protein